MKGGENLSTGVCHVRIAGREAIQWWPGTQPPCLPGWVASLEAAIGGGRAGYLLDDESESGWMPYPHSFRPHRELPVFPFLLFP
jgi:hypothetical protein